MLACRYWVAGLRLPWRSGARYVLLVLLFLPTEGTGFFPVRPGGMQKEVSSYNSSSVEMVPVQAVVGAAGMLFA